MFRSILAKLYPSERTGAGPSRRPSFAPRLEALDDRLVPTAVAVDGPNFYIDGDYWADDYLTVRAHGGGGFTVTDAAGVQFEVGADKRLIIHTHFGNDVVRYATDGAFSGTWSQVLVDLGEGNDRFTGTLNRDLTNGTFLGLYVEGQGGADLITVYGTPTAPNRANDHLTNGLVINTGGMFISSSSTLEVELSGGGGGDRLYFDYEGELDGGINLRFYGDSGDDVVSARLTLASTSSGRVGDDIIALVSGGWGSDTLTFQVFDNSGGQVYVDGLINGDGPPLPWPGQDFAIDRAYHTSNVLAWNCESVY